MKKKKLIILISIATVVLAFVVILGLAVITPTLFQKENADVSSEDAPQIAEKIEGLEVIGSEEPASTENTTIETDETTLTPTETNSDTNIWEKYGLEDPTAGMEDDDYLEHEEILIEGPIELEEPITETLFYLDNPAYLNMETNLGENGFFNFYDCIEDYLDYYFPEDCPKEYGGAVIEGSYKDKGDIRTFYIEFYPNYPETEEIWTIECNYVVSMNYYEFFCDNINPKAEPNFPAN